MARTRGKDSLGPAKKGGRRRKIVHVFTEGRVTEPEYIKIVRDRAGATGVEVRIANSSAPGSQRKPIKLVEAAENVLLPEHAEKITSTFRAYAEVPGFSRVVSREELLGNDDNLNIRRYVDNTPSPEPQDVRAHLIGGVPRAEIEAKKELLDAYGVGLGDLFAERYPVDREYVDFLPEGRRPDVARLGELARPREDELRATFERWWEAEARHLEAVAATPERLADLTPSERKAALMGVRSTLIESFVERLGGVGLLDRYALAGAVAEAKYDLLALSEIGFAGVLDGWVENVETLLAPEQDPKTRKERKRTAAERRQAYDHKMVAAIAPDFLEELAAADRVVAELTDKIQVAQQAVRAAAEVGAEESGDTGEPVPASAVTTLGAAGIGQLKKQQAEARRVVAALEDDFWFLPKSHVANAEENATSRLIRARNALAARQGERQMVLEILRQGLRSRLDDLVQDRRQEFVRAYENWWEKYGLSFQEIEQQLTGTAEGTIASNPWSQRSAWDLMADSASVIADRSAVAELIHSLIDAEKAVEGALAKLSVDELMVLLPMVDSGAASQVQRCPLREVVTSARTGAVHRPEGQLGVPVLRPADLTDRELKLSRLRPDKAGLSPRPDRREAMLSPEDVLLAAIDAEGRTFRAAVWREQRAQATYSSNVICLRPDTRHLAADYLAAWLMLPTAQKRIYAVARSAGGMYVVNPVRLLDVDIELPSMADQEVFVQRLATLTRERRVRHAQLAKLHRVKATLMNNLTQSGRK